MRDFAVGNMAARFGDLKPVQVADGLGCLRDGISDRVIAARGRRSRQFNVLVRMLGLVVSI